MTSPAFHLVVADDHPLFRSALRETVRSALPDARIDEAETLDRLRDLLRSDAAIDLVLLDLRMPGADGLSSLVELRAAHPEVPVLVVSAAEERVIVDRARDLGAAGFVPKSASTQDIARGIERVLAGDTCFPGGSASEDPEEDLASRLRQLTPQQLRVFSMLSGGRLNKQIAADLDVTEATVKAHVTSILRKLGIYRRTQAAVMAQRLFGSQGSMPVTPPS